MSFRKSIAALAASAASVVPECLLDQLAPGGRMVVPVNGGYGQDLLLVHKDGQGVIHRRKLLPVAFVPFVGGPGAGSGEGRGASP